MKYEQKKHQMKAMSDAIFVAKRNPTSKLTVTFIIHSEASIQKHVMVQMIQKGKIWNVKTQTNEYEGNIYTGEIDKKDICA